MSIKDPTSRKKYHAEYMAKYHRKGCPVKKKRADCTEEELKTIREADKKHREKYRTQRLAYHKRKRESPGYYKKYAEWERGYFLRNPNAKLIKALRRRMHRALKRHLKGSGTFTLLGENIQVIRQHIESLFKPGMNWENYGRGHGKWNIDHIRPCASFDLTDHEQQKQCFHYSNLQPLWAEENFRKGAKIL